MGNKKQTDQAEVQTQEVKTTIEEISTEAADAAAINEVQETQTESVETVKAEMLERVKRLQADFDNYRRRTRQEQCDLSAYVTQNLIKDLLPVIDNFERALASKPAEDPSGFSAGVEMIYRQFYAVLEKQGVSAVETVGAMFDPAKHEAIMRDEESDQPESTIVAELQKGYMACGKIIRPALVKVAGK